MRGSELAEVVAAAVDRIVNTREAIGTLDKVVGTICRFSGRDTTSYLESYMAEMVMRDIPEDRRLAAFPCVATLGIYTEVLEVQAECPTWGKFKARLLEKYELDDALYLWKWDFMEWVETLERRGMCRRFYGSSRNVSCGSRRLTGQYWTQATSYCLLKQWTQRLLSQW